MLLIVACMMRAATITVQGPTQVAVGEQFQIRYVVNTTDITGFRMGNVPDAFDVLMGPSTSTQRSYSIVNGKTSQSSSVTYTYVLMANKNGTFVIPSARGVVDGKTITSAALRITVSGKAQSGSGQSSHRQQSSARVDRAGARISGNDLFIKVSANRNSVYEQEPVLLTYKVYTQVELTQLEGKMPDLNGFHTQEIPLPQQKTFHIETVNGRQYNCVTWSQYVMFPQISGKLEIPSITFKGIVVQQNPDIDPFEAFFNGGSSYVEVKKEIKAPALSLTVKPLPTKPSDFSGGVGRFTFSASLDKQEVKAGDAVNLTVKVSGVGNMKLIKQPTLQLPADFDCYDPKVDDKTRLTTNGLSGDMIYTYLIVPRNMGKYELPPVTFTYFDTTTKTYKTLSTQAMTLTVVQGDANGKNASQRGIYNGQADLDIHDIMTNAPTLRLSQGTFFGSSTHYVVNILLLLIAATLIWLLRKHIKQASDIVGSKTRRANKVAVNRLRKAARLLSQQRETEFYDEVLRALWGYIGDKFNMPVEQLSRENIEEVLTSKNVDGNTIESFIAALEECEYARFAPGDKNGNMSTTYDKATAAITVIEENVR